MLFNSLAFAIFLPLVWIAYYSTYGALRTRALLGASLFFYGWWRVEYVPIMVASAAFDYILGRAIEGSNSHARRRELLVLSVASNIAVLIYYKYLGMFSEWYVMVALHWDNSLLPPIVDLMMPIGISFHRFQGQGYVMDVFRKQIKAERSIEKFLLFIFYFPQLVAGPIERASHLLGQLHGNHVFRSQEFRRGFGLMLIGFAKKVVIADRLAPAIMFAYSEPAARNPLSLLFATYMFAFQIYCDFSGYSDIARGVSRTLGIDLMKNFNQPYLATSISDFWRRWHISLSTWFKDYLYFPLGGNRVSTVVWVRNIFVVFIFSGLWHGANITFVIWGALHAVYMVGERFGARVFTTIYSCVENSVGKMFADWVARAFVFHLVTFAWIFFRAKNFDDAWNVVSKIANLRHAGQEILGTSLHMFGQDASAIDKAALAASLILLWLPLLHMVQNKLDEWKRWRVLYAFLVAFILFFGVFVEQSFIYFQF